MRGRLGSTWRNYARKVLKNVGRNLLTIAELKLEAVIHRNIVSSVFDFLAFTFKAAVLSILIARLSSSFNISAIFLITSSLQLLRFNAYLALSLIMSKTRSTEYFGMCINVNDALVAGSSRRKLSFLSETIIMHKLMLKSLSTTTLKRLKWSRHITSLRSLDLFLRMLTSL